MGTNYYYEPAGQEDPPGRIHIGKSSAGWVFSLHVVNDLGLFTFKDWEAYWRNNPGRIVNEYEETIPVAEMVKTITGRSPYFNGRPLLRQSNVDSQRAEYGGSTWDTVTGDFS